MDYHVLEEAAYQVSQRRRLQSSARLQVQKDAIVSNAVEKTQAAHAAAGPMSKRARRGSIRENRARDRQIESDQNTWVLGEGGANVDTTLKALRGAPESSTSDNNYVPPSSKATRIGELLEQELSKDEK